MRLSKTLIGLLMGVLFAGCAGTKPLGESVTVSEVGEGWANNSVNAVIFRRNSVTTFKDTQFTAYYDPESRLVLAKRKLGEQDWEVYQTRYTGNTADAHNTISIAVDGEGYLQDRKRSCRERVY